VGDALKCGVEVLVTATPGPSSVSIIKVQRPPISPRTQSLLPVNIHMDNRSELMRLVTVLITLTEGTKTVHATGGALELRNFPDRRGGGQVINRLPR